MPKVFRPLTPADVLPKLSVSIPQVHYDDKGRPKLGHVKIDLLQHCKDYGKNVKT